MRVQYDHQLISKEFQKGVCLYLESEGVEEKDVYIIYYTNRGFTFVYAEYVVKCRISPCDSLYREVASINAIKNRVSCVPIPEHIEIKEVSGIVFSKFKYVDGVTLSSAIRDNIIGYNDIKEIVSVLKIIRKSIANEITDKEEGLCKIEADSKYYIDRLESRQKYRCVLEDEVVRKIMKIMEDKVPDGSQYAFQHCDLSLDNIIIGADKRIAAILDWEDSCIMPTSYEDAYLAYAVPSRDIQGVIDQPIKSMVTLDFEVLLLSYLFNTDSVIQNSASRFVDKWA